MRSIILAMCLLLPALAIADERKEVHPWEGKDFIRWKDDAGRWHVEPNPFVSPAIQDKDIRINKDGLKETDRQKFDDYQRRLKQRREIALIKRAEYNRNKKVPVYDPTRAYPVDLYDFGRSFYRPIPNPNQPRVYIRRRVIVWPRPVIYPW